MTIEKAHRERKANQKIAISKSCHQLQGWMDTVRRWHNQGLEPLGRSHRNYCSRDREKENCPGFFLPLFHLLSRHPLVSTSHWPNLGRKGVWEMHFAGSAPLMQSQGKTINRSQCKQTNKCHSIPPQQPYMYPKLKVAFIPFFYFNLPLFC